jgi:ribosomal protein S25
LDQANYDRIITGIPKLGKHISISGVVDKYKVTGGIARILLNKLFESGTLKKGEAHSRQALFYPAVTAVEKTAVAAETKETKK